MKQYKVVDGTSYPVNTPDRVVDVLERCRRLNIRITVDYGDTDTGRSWNELFDVTGYVGRTTGIKSPILVYNKRSRGGGLILCDCIIKIVTSKGKTVLYQHPNYHSEI